MERIVSVSQLLHIAQRTLNNVDSRLVGHGERVSVIVYELLKLFPRSSPKQRSDVCIMALLHDIGAYKTECIDELMSFETVGVWEHATYGYLFLRNLSPLGDNALPVLYHHLDYCKYGEVNDVLAEDDYAGLIYLADRIDILIVSKGIDFCRKYIVANRGQKFSPVWVDLLWEADKQFGVLDRIARRNTFPLFEEMVENIELSADEIWAYLNMIALVIDFRSEFMVLHTVTTINVSRVLGVKLGLSALEQTLLDCGALLHDLGKVASPVDILEKPGKLTPEEMAIMQQHVVVTREILEGLIDPRILKIASRHHEKLDGTGYPEGLFLKDLTFPERVAAVADIVSALIRRRSYKEAFDKATTISILQRMSDNGQICSSVTKVLLDNFDEIVAQAEEASRNVTESYQNIKHRYVTLLEQRPRN